jgi:glucose-1-phosphate thymidylyltransferase
MKGVLICGGTGSRLRPLTEITNKSLLPIYDKPLILYPLQILLDAGIKDIAVITGAERIDQMSSFLASGARFGCTFSYKIQDEPRGIAHALSLAEEFVDGDDVCAILGDNVYFDDLTPTITDFEKGGHIFLKEVSDPERFGVVELKDGKPVGIEEKPSNPKSSYAQTGCYVYDSQCFDVIRNLTPSNRGELEITDVTKWYLEQKKLGYTILKDKWIDAGTFESLFKASELVRERKTEIIENTKETVLQKEETPMNR